MVSQGIFPSHCSLLVATRNARTLAVASPIPQRGARKGSMSENARSERRKALIHDAMV